MAYTEMGEDGMTILWAYEMFAPRAKILALARRRPSLPLTDEQKRRYGLTEAGR